MAIAQGATNQFKLGLASGLFDFAVDTFKIALYTGAANIGADTDSYTTDGETSGTGYVAGGQVLTISQAPTFGSAGGAVLYLSFADAVWDPAEFTARGALIYKDGGTNPTVCVLDFGGDKTATTTFTVQFPAANPTNAIIRMA